MKFKLLFPSVWLLAAGFFASSAAANPCPSNLSDPLAYQRHHNPDRCEGIRRQNISSSFSWVSFATSNLRRYGSTLRLKLPEVGENPTLTVRAYSRRYQLDPLEFQPRGDWYEFSLQTDILQQAHVAPESLRAIASLPGSQPIYVPVVIDSPSPRYNFVFYSPSRAIVRSFEQK
ncbi:hypothetical protein [Baaleninema sp.]|uniref:hypothetical protein n=1 Tax=Baaleninema sp. TaxID=3101197 RepID=UPI003D0451A5